MYVQIRLETTSAGGRNSHSHLRVVVRQDPPFLVVAVVLLYPAGERDGGRGGEGRGERDGEGEGEG